MPYNSRHVTLAFDPFPPSPQRNDCYCTLYIDFLTSFSTRAYVKKVHREASVQSVFARACHRPINIYCRVTLTCFLQCKALALPTVSKFGCRAQLLLLCWDPRSGASALFQTFRPLLTVDTPPADPTRVLQPAALLSGTMRSGDLKNLGENTAATVWQTGE